MEVLSFIEFNKSSRIRLQNVEKNHRICILLKINARILWIFLAISVQVFYTIHNKQIKNDFSTRRLNV